MYFRRKASAGRAYLQIVERRRDGDQVRQQVIATLGRFDELQASGQLEGRGGGATVRPSTRPAREAPHLRMHWIENGDGRIYDLPRSLPDGPNIEIERHPIVEAQTGSAADCQKPGTRDHGKPGVGSLRSRLPYGRDRPGKGHSALG